MGSSGNRYIITLIMGTEMDPEKENFNHLP
jgi:hypothetical protein